MPEAGLFEQATRSIGMVLGNEQATRQNADRTFQHAHILIEHDVRDFGSIQQSLDGGNQHSIIGADKLAQ